MNVIESPGISQGDTVFSENRVPSRLHLTCGCFGSRAYELQGRHSYNLCFSHGFYSLDVQDWRSLWWHWIQQSWFLNWKPSRQRSSSRSTPPTPITKTPPQKINLSDEHPVTNSSAILRLARPRRVWYILHLPCVVPGRVRHELRTLLTTHLHSLVFLGKWGAVQLRIQWIIDGKLLISYVAVPWILTRRSCVWCASWKILLNGSLGQNQYSQDMKQHPQRLAKLNSSVQR